MSNAVPTAVPTNAPPTGDPAARSALFIVFLVVVIDLLGFGIVLPLLAALRRSVCRPALTHRAGVAARRRRLARRRHRRRLMAVFSLMQFLFAPLWGRVSDRVGRRPILLIGLAGSVVVLHAVRLRLRPAAGASAPACPDPAVRRRASAPASPGATIATAQAVIADCTPPEKRKHGMALIGMAFGIGFTFGPLVGGRRAVLCSPTTTASSATCAAGLSLLALVLGIILLPETRQFGDAPPLKRKLFDLRGRRARPGQPPPSARWS